MVSWPPLLIEAALMLAATVMPISLRLVSDPLPSRLPLAALTSTLALSTDALRRSTLPSVLRARKRFVALRTVAMPSVPMMISRRVVTKMSLAETVPDWTMPWITSLLLAWPI